MDPKAVCNRNGKSRPLASIVNRNFRFETPALAQAYALVALYTTIIGSRKNLGIAGNESAY
jgi:hypothetical protein